MSVRLAVALVVALPAGAFAAPDFVPNPRQAFDGFVAINAPRAEVPVGALWINGFGPVGDGASADNLAVERSLNGMQIDRQLQIGLTAELFNLIGIDPRFRNRYSARFTDLSIIRVKDVSRLTGPRGEPRIVAAIKAGSIVVSTDGELGFNARTIGWEVRDGEGSSAVGRTRANAIEGRDLFIAIRVATPSRIEGKELRLKAQEVEVGLSARMDDYRITFRTSGCEPTSVTECRPISAGIVKLTSWPSDGLQEFAQFDGRGEVLLHLPVPTASDDGGLYDRVRVRWERACRQQESCEKAPRLFARFEGEHLNDFAKPESKGW